MEGHDETYIKLFNMLYETFGNKNIDDLSSLLSVDVIKPLLKEM